MRKSAVFLALVFCVVLVLPSYGRTHEFKYDSSLSAARNEVAKYAYEILNYEWTTNKYILRYMGTDDQGHRIASGYTTGTIHGVPYNVDGGDFQSYKSLNISLKEERNGTYYMKYGLVCASLVTECIKQGFPSTENLPIWQSCLFHKNGDWRKYISSVSDSVYDYSHEKWEWQKIWTDINWTQRNSGYPAYQKLKRGDYLDNWKHCILVIDNNKAAKTLTYIDQSTCYYNPQEYDRVGTRIKYNVSYSTLADENYVPMYVNYPDTNSGISIAANFPDPVFRDYVSYYDTNHDGYFSDAEIEAITDFSWHGGPHPDNVNPNAWSGYEPKALINENGNGEKWANIKSIEGVKLFKNLESLYVYNDSLSGAIDISGMKKLKDFRCYGNRITSINASNCSALQRIECQSNRLSSINLAGCSQLEYLDVSDNYLRSLRFDDYTFDTSRLKTLKCRDNLLTYLSALYCDSLQVVDCSSNMLYSLYLNGCPNLTEIYCQNNSSLRSISLGTVSTKKLKVLEHDSSLDSALRSYLPRITSSNIPSTASVGKSYSGYIKASGSGIITYGSTALLSAHGLTINEDTGRITGTPKYSGTYSYKFFAENFAGTVSRDATITITGRNAPRIITTSIKTLKKGTYYGPSAFYTNNIPVKATGGTVPMTWSKYSGTLPAGLSLSYTSSNTVYLTGTPKTTGYYGFTLKVWDRYGLEDTQYFYVRVK